jgi:hypothetical protein
MAFGKLKVNLTKASLDSHCKKENLPLGSCVAALFYTELHAAAATMVFLGVSVCQHHGKGSLILSFKREDATRGPCRAT